MCFDLDHSSQNQVHHLDMVTGAVIADSFDKCNGIAFDTGKAMAYVQVPPTLCDTTNLDLLMFTRTDTCAIEGNSGND